MWLTIKEVCKIYKLKKSTLYLWANSGQIPCYRINGLLRFKKEEIDEWFSNHKISPVEIEIKTRRVASDIIEGYHSPHGETRPIRARKGG